MAIFSKPITIHTSCRDYVHPWSDSCVGASLSLFRPCLVESLRIYVTAYAVALLMRGKIPSGKDIYKTCLGVIRSCIFLICHGIGFSSMVCLLRWALGNFSFLSISFLPSFLSSIVAILIERPSRRGLLSLYVTNVASETLFRMAVSRNLIKPVPCGDVIIFALSMSSLMYLYRGHVLPKDMIHSFLKFLVGPYEEYDPDKDFNSEPIISTPDDKGRINSFPLWLKNLVNSLKSKSRGTFCPHPFSCIYYVVQGGVQNFVIGYILQLLLKLLMNAKTIVRKPSIAVRLPFRGETMRLGLTFGLFTTAFRGISCGLRQMFKKDSPFLALPAGLVAGLAFYFYRDNTFALYFMWKTLQICYNKGVDNGYVPELKYAPVFFHAFSTAILFHVALLEPLNLRPSYWNFLLSMSGGKIGQMDRTSFAVFGLNSQEQLKRVLENTRKRR